MKKFLILAILFLLNKNIYAQKLTFSLLRQPQTAYLGMENTMSCMVEGVSCESIILSTNNGSIKKFSACYYVYKPSTTGDVKIRVSKNANNKFKKIGEFSILVRNIPDPVAWVGGLSGGYIRKDALNAQEGIGSCLPTFLGIYVNYEVKSFVITAIRKNEQLFFKSYNNNMFSPEIHELFKTLQKDDTVLFSSISILMSDQKTVLAKPLEFIIQ